VVRGRCHDAFRAPQPRQEAGAGLRVAQSDERRAGRQLFPRDLLSMTLPVCPGSPRLGAVSVNSQTAGVEHRGAGNDTGGVWRSATPGSGPAQARHSVR
jgi:hypothetical protein